MAWIELTLSDLGAAKIAVNTDNIVRFGPRYPSGSIVRGVSPHDRGGKTVYEFDVEEAPADIEALLAKAGITVYR